MIAVLAVIVTFAALQAPPAYDTPDLRATLYKSVFVQGPGSLAAADLEKLPADASARLERYLARRAAFVSRLKGGASSLKDVAIEAKRRRIESGIVALIDAPDIQQLAADYAAGAAVLNDWEGSAAGPLSEASHAEDFLKRHPSTPLAPYLYALIALRQRAAFEMMTVETHKSEMVAAAKKYRTFLQRARASADPVFKWLADDIDRQPKVHTASPFHPRDFNPDT